MCSLRMVVLCAMQELAVVSEALGREWEGRHTKRVVLVVWMKRPLLRISRFLWCTVRSSDLRVV